MSDHAASPVCQGVARFDDEAQAQYVAHGLSREFDAPFHAVLHGEHWHVLERPTPDNPPSQVPSS